MDPMFSVELICSDVTCEFTLASVGELRELEALVCDCGCCLQIVSISEAELVEARVPTKLLFAA